MAYLPLDPATLGVVQIAVPSYALRLTRAFGAPRVGWSLVGVFVCLALVNVVGWLMPNQPGVEISLALLFVLAPVLLLIGLRHVESVTRERGRAERAQMEEERLRDSFERKLEENTAALAATIEELRRGIAAHSEAEASLCEAEAQYRLLFLKNPLAMWAFDLRTLQILAVNEAALRMHNYEREEFMDLTASRLCVPGQTAAFQNDALKPCCGPQSRGIWLHRRKDGSMVGVEVTAVDLKYAGCPARLMVARAVYHPGLSAANS